MTYTRIVIARISLLLPAALLAQSGRRAVPVAATQAERDVQIASGVEAKP